MRMKVVFLTGLVAGFGLASVIAGCSSKPSCKLLYKRYRDCKKSPLTEGAFVSACDKLKDKLYWKERIRCSTNSDCSVFKKCISQAEKKARAVRMDKRWKDAMEKVAKGKYASAIGFCEMWKDELSAKYAETCKGLPARATAATMKEITAKRDAGKVSYEDVKCWDLKRYAKKAGPAEFKKADLLCKEIALARTVKKVKEAVAKNLRKASPILPYGCFASQLDTYSKLGSPYAKKAVALLVNECYQKLGLYILEKNVPKQSKDVYEGIKRYKITGPKIDALMKKAAEKYETKKP